MRYHDLTGLGHSFGESLRCSGCGMHWHDVQYPPTPPACTRPRVFNGGREKGCSQAARLATQQRRKAWPEQ